MTVQNEIQSRGHLRKPSRVPAVSAMNRQTERERERERERFRYILLILLVKAALSRSVCELLPEHKDILSPMMCCLGHLLSPKLGSRTAISLSIPRWL